MDRPNIDTTLMTIAILFGDRSTCSRKQVGAVIARDSRVISSGYNGAPAGMPHCDHSRDHEIIPMSYTDEYILKTEGCKVAVHAEVNAIAFAARYGLRTEGCTLYTTLSPCVSCAQLIINAGITRVVWDEIYRDTTGAELLKKAGATIDRIS